MSKIVSRETLCFSALLTVYQHFLNNSVIVINNLEFKMSRFIKYHKTLTIMLVVTFLSLMNTSDIEPRKIFSIPHFDKIVHFLMYFTMAFFLMFEYYLHHKHKITRIVQILLIPLFWGASMEMAQFLLTNYRGAEWWDMIANTLGVITAYFFVYIFRHNKLISYLILFPFNKRQPII